MKRLSLLIVSVLVVMFFAGMFLPAAFGADQALIWETDLNKAIQAAARKKAEIMVVFTAPAWCSHCRDLEREVFSQKDFKDLARDKLVLVKLDYPADRSRWGKAKTALLRKYGIKGFPSYLLLDSRGKIILIKPGYASGKSAEYIKEIQAALAYFESLAGKPIDMFVNSFFPPNVRPEDIPLEELVGGFLGMIKYQETCALDIAIKWRTKNADLLKKVEAGIKKTFPNYYFAPVSGAKDTYELKK